MIRKLITYFRSRVEARKLKPQASSESAAFEINKASSETAFEDTGDFQSVSVALPIEAEIDLHTFAPRDIPRAVEAYLREAHRCNFKSVRLIHGKGRGVQRAVVRRLLAQSPLVASFTDAPPYAGGWGATVAHFNFTNDFDFTNDADEVTGKCENLKQVEL